MYIESDKNSCNDLGLASDGSGEAAPYSCRGVVFCAALCLPSSSYDCCVGVRSDDGLSGGLPRL